MAGVWGMTIKWTFYSAVIGFALMQVAKPSEQELDKVRKFSKQNAQFSAVLQAASKPGAKPMYQQKPGEQHPLPELAAEALKENK